MKTLGTTLVVAASLAFASAANADPVLMHGSGSLGAPAGTQATAGANFGASFRLSASRGEMLLNSAGSSSSTYMLRQDLGSLKQVKDVVWSFVLQHDAFNGFTMSMTGVRNGEHSQTVRTIKWGQTYGASTTWASVPGQGVAPMNALQLAARATRETVSSGLSFTSIQFDSRTLGSGEFGSGQVASRGIESENLWLTFDEGTDLRRHTWTLTGFLSGFRDTIPGGDGHVGVDIFGQSMMAVVPLPPAAWAGLSTLAGVGLVGFVRRRRQIAN